MPDPKNPGERTKAHRLRQAVKHGQTLQPVDQLWLAEYNEKDGRSKDGRSKNYGRSRSARKINLQVEEAAEAEGEGNAAVAAASAALVAKEEGRRIDSLLIAAIEAMVKSAAINRDTALMLREDYGSIFELLARRTEIYENTHIEILTAWRQNYIAATQAEGALMQKDQEGDPANAMLLAVIAKQLGIDLPPGAAAAAGRPRPRPPNAPPPNGVPKT